MHELSGSHRESSGRLFSLRTRLLELLRLAGLSETEAKVYMALLALKRASARAIVAESGVHMMTAYRTLKKLREKGLLKVEKINGKESSYRAPTLHALIGSLEANQRNLQSIEHALRGLEPMLKFIGNSRNEAFEPVSIREGVEAFREEYLKLPNLCRSEYLHIGCMENYWRIAGMGDDSPEENAFRNARYRRGVFARVINTDSPVIREVAKRDSKEMRTLKIADELPIRRDYVGFADDHIAHFICDESLPRVVLIRHPELVALHHSHFRTLWERGANV